jgi:hypothetical protein
MTSGIGRPVESVAGSPDENFDEYATFGRLIEFASGSVMDVDVYTIPLGSVMAPGAGLIVLRGSLVYAASGLPRLLFATLGALVGTKRYPA